MLSETVENGNNSTDIGTVENDENGRFEFDSLNFTQADVGKEFYYTVKEINDSQSGYTYDKTVYKIKLQVNDNGDGTLEIVDTTVKNTDSNNSDATKIEFTNHYTKADDYLLSNDILKTGDNSNAIGFVLMTVILLTGLLFANKKRKVDNN